MLLKKSVPNVLLSIAYWALNMDKGVKIVSSDQQGLVCSRDLNVFVFAISTTVTLHCMRMQVHSEGMFEVFQFKAIVWPKVTSEST